MGLLLIDQAQMMVPRNRDREVSHFHATVVVTLT
jgi:hypothetical protein